MQSVISRTRVKVDEDNEAVGKGHRLTMPSRSYTCQGNRYGSSAYMNVSFFLASNCRGRESC